MANKYEIMGNEVTHTGVCPHTGEPFTRTYWVRSSGYVREWDGTGWDRQPTDENGNTWRCAPNGNALRDLVKREFRREFARAARR
jgi:hypothetical protein